MGKCFHDHKQLCIHVFVVADVKVPYPKSTALWVGRPHLHILDGDGDSTTQ